MCQAFLYIWHDNATGKKYIGSHKGSIEDGYVCSSKYMMEEYNKRPQDFSRQIIAEGKFENIRKLESAILKSVNAALDEQFYNKSNNDGNFYFEGWKSENITEEHRKNMSIAAKKRLVNGITKEHAEKLHAGRRASKNSPEHAAAVIASRVGSKHSEEAKKKMSEKKIANPNTKKIASNAGSTSAKKRKESGYYQSEEYKKKMKAGWEKRRAKKEKEGLVNGD